MKKVDDTARGLPITPATAAAVAMDLIGQKKPRMACCPNDSEPLIGTFKFRGAEFVCMVCGSLFGFLSPTPKDETPELTARYEYLKQQFDEGVPPGEIEQA